MTTAAAPAPPAMTKAPAAAGPGGFTHRQILAILSGLMLGMFLAALDQNIVSTSIRTIADDLHGLNLQAWATTAYLITATISTPLYGKLSDLYGRKPFFLAAISIFVVGSILCTISTSMYELAAFRALQGLGAGGLMSLALTIIGDIVPPRERARYQGYFLAVFGTSSVLGPVLGGLLAGTDTIIGITGWRWVFLVNVPIGIVALFVVWRVLNIPHSRREHRIDFPGAVALAVTLVPVLIVAEQGREWGWGSGSSILCYVIGVVGLIGFIVAERVYKDDALLPLRLFQNQTFSLTSIIAIITGIGLFGGIALVPQYLQIVTGSTPTRAGLEMLPLIGGLMISSIISGQLTSRTGRYKIFPVIGLGLMTVGLLLFHFLLHFDTPYWEIAIVMAVFGLGVGQCMQTLVLAVQNAVPAKDMGVATASATFFRQMGGTLGVAVFLSILFSTVGDKIGEAFAAILPTASFQAAAADPTVLANPANAVALNPASGAASVVQDSSVLQRMDARLAEPFLVGFSNAMDTVFLVAGCVVAVGFVLIFFLREIPLRTTSGIQAREEEGRPTPPADTVVDSAGATEGWGPTPAPLDVPTSSTPVRADADAPVGSRAPSPSPSPTPSPTPRSTGGRHEGPSFGDASAVPHDGRTADGRDGVVGRVLAGGRGAAGVVVTLHDLEGAVLARARTSDDGAYRLAAPASIGTATSVLIVSSSEHRPYARLVRVDGDQPLADVTLAPAEDLTGLVREAGVGGAAVPDASVTITDALGAVAAVRRTDAEGRFAVSGLAPGDHTVVVFAGGEPTATTITVPDDGSGAGHHEITVEAVLATVAGTLRSTSGAPVPESLVVLVGTDGAVRASTVTDADGRFRVDGVAPGRCMLTASGFAPVSREVVVSGADPEPVAIVVEPPRPLVAGTPSADAAGGARDGVVDDAPTGPVADRETLRQAVAGS